MIEGVIGGPLIDGHLPTVADDCLLRNAWICPEYVRTRAGDLTTASVTHLRITVISVLVGAVIALPLALLALVITGVILLALFLLEQVDWGVQLTRL